jgi:hypothetical protein
MRPGVVQRMAKKAANRWWDATFKFNYSYTMMMFPSSDYPHITADLSSRVVGPMGGPPGLEDNLVNITFTKFHYSPSAHSERYGYSEGADGWKADDSGGPHRDEADAAARALLALFGKALGEGSRERGWSVTPKTGGEIAKAKVTS